MKNEISFCKKQLVNLSICICALSITGCTEHFINDSLFREKVEKKYNSVEESVSFDSPFVEQMNNREKEAVKFLYAYMPLNDLVDKSSSYYLANIRSSFAAQKELTWGKKIPELLFRHFVLPIRINNENLDASRMAFYKELKPRVENLSMYDAILAVNHWCHEKVKYSPSDQRTMAPLACVKKATGRCGEESTFTVAALRSVGIPARQVYTPRWAHTDDNHAWVEAWADGKWYFLGACEPEPVLNLGWFNSSASRGMLMHTRVFGYYNGPEEIMKRTANYTEINVIDNYAKTSRVDLTILDEHQQAVPHAHVEFKIYNYAEFYTVAVKETDDNGKTFLTAGKGDLLVWASHKGKFGFKKISFDTNKEISLVINLTAKDSIQTTYDIVPPVGDPQIPNVTEEQKKTNEKLLANEDAIRTSYEATFLSPTQAADFVTANHLVSTTAPLLVTSRGNHKTIQDFLLQAIERGIADKAQALLVHLSKKDLCDVTEDVLMDHLLYSSSSKEVKKSDFYRFVQNPRIAYEMITPYKQYLQKKMGTKQMEVFQNNPSQLIQWIKKTISIRDDLNAQHLYQSPIGVLDTKVTDQQSRNIFFVAMARSCGIPAWINEVNGKLQYIDVTSDQQIFDIDFEQESPQRATKGNLVLDYTPTKLLDNPRYYQHFTLAKLVNGHSQLLNYDEQEVDMGGGTSWKNTFKDGCKLDTGDYLLTTGTRLANGAVLSTLTRFTITEGKATTVELKLRTDKKQIQVIGSLNAESNYQAIGAKELQSILSTVGRGYYVLGIVGVNQEPTNHALKDIEKEASSFETWKRPILLLFTSKEQSKRFKANDFPTLPNTIKYGIDTTGNIRAAILKEMRLTDKNALPLFVIADSFNRIVFCSQGYTIGLGHQLLQIINGLQTSTVHKE